MTPEGLALKAITEYLNACRLGKLKRRNVGALRVGDAPTHPWAKDARRIVRFGEPGESDLELELTGRPQRVFIEVKPLGWRPPNPPKPGAAPSTLKKYRHHLDQVAFLDRQRGQGHFGFFATCPHDVWVNLSAVGFLGMPIPGPGRPQGRSKRQRRRGGLMSLKPSSGVDTAVLEGVAAGALEGLVNPLHIHAISEVVARAILAHFAHQQVYFSEAALNTYRNREISRLARTGNSAELAAQYGLSPQHIRRIVAAGRKAKL